MSFLQAIERWAWSPSSDMAEAKSFSTWTSPASMALLRGSRDGSGSGIVAEGGLGDGVLGEESRGDAIGEQRPLELRPQVDAHEEGPEGVPGDYLIGRLGVCPEGGTGSGW
jgi:hypothetical protein